MARIAEAARTIAWTSDDAWRRLAVAVATHPRSWDPPAHGPRVEAEPDRTATSGNAEVVVEEDVDAADPVLVLRAAATAARHGAVIERRSLERLAAAASPWLEPWDDEMRLELIELLGAGPWAIRVIEGLDQRGVWGCVLPEWAPVRSRPQPGAFHDFTVDRHLLETVAAASRLTVAGVSAGPPADGGAVARHRQGVRGRPCGGRRSYRRARLRADGVRARRHRDRRLARRAASAPARRRHPSRHRRSRDDAAGGEPGRHDRPAPARWRRSRKPTASRPARRRGIPGPRT